MELESGQEPYQQLTLVPREASFASVEGLWRSVQQSVPFLDFVVDGVSLRTMAAHAGYGTDFVTPLCRCWSASHVATAVDQLLGGDEASGELVEMLVCKVCGDRDCGAILAEVTVGAEDVIWSDWRWTDFHPGDAERIDMPTVRFERVAYEQLVSGAAALVAALPYEQTAGRRRRFWPWQWGWRLPPRTG